MPHNHILKAPLSGTVEAIHVSDQQAVSTGELLITLESMKVHVRIEADNAGHIQKVKVAVGDTVSRGDELVELLQSNTSTQTQEPNLKQHKVHSSLSDFKNRQAKTLDENRSTAIQKRHAKGYLSARENLANLCEPNDFNEYGQFAVAAQRHRKDYQDLQTDTAADGIITGLAAVNTNKFSSQAAQTALVINDYSVLAGTQGFFHHQKLDRILDVAGKQKLPVIMFSEGGGGRPGDTDITTVISGLQCTSFGAWAGLSGVVPRISVANGYNFAGNAALFGAGDITIATKNSWIGMAGPAMIEGGGLGSFKATDIGPIDVQMNNGVVDIVADDEAHAAQLAKQVLSYFQGDFQDHVENTEQDNNQRALQSALPENRRETYNVRSIINTLADVDSFIELKANYGGSIITGFMRLNGKAIGVLANDCMVLGGAIDVAAGEKAADFMSLCNSFNIPLVSLCDTPGFMVGPAHEEQGAVRRLAKLFTAGAQLKVPLIAVVLRKCYGLGAQAMLGGSTLRPSYTLAWPTGEFGAMGLEGAVSLGFKKELDACETEEKRTALFNQLLSQAYQRGQAIEVASVLEIDAVIDPKDTRKRILASLLSNKQVIN